MTINIRRIIFLGLLLFGTCCFALEEHQAGQIDWHREQIGAVEYAVFGELGTNGNAKSMFVGTSEGVVAKLRMKTGELGEIIGRISISY